MSIQDLKEHRHKLLATSIHNIKVSTSITPLDYIFCHGKGHVIGNCPYRGNQVFGHPSYVPFSTSMMSYLGLSSAFLVVQHQNFHFHVL